VRLYEYEGKEIFKQYGISVPRGIVVTTGEQARQAAVSIGKQVVVKSQILGGGRGKAGGIRVAETPKEAEEIAQEQLGRELMGYKVKELLVEEKLDIENEIYMGVTIDDVSGMPIAIVSAKGGIAIEEVARESPASIARSLVDPMYGLRGYEAINLVSQMQVTGKALASASSILGQLYKVFESYDMRITEINPLVITSEGKLVAADSRGEIDDHSLFRHPELEKVAVDRIQDFWEREGAKAGANYVELGGNIAVMANGAGLAMSLLDMIDFKGGRAGCFLETGGGLSKERMRKGVSILLKKAKSDPRLKVIFVMARMMMSPPDAVAEGLIEAVNELEVAIPVVAVMRGRESYQKRARELLKGTGVKLYLSVEEGVNEAIRIAAK
jgi:succinyl-CoA synthetase beta subunit